MRRQAGDDGASSQVMTWCYFWCSPILNCGCTVHWYQFCEFLMLVYNRVRFSSVMSPPCLLISSCWKNQPIKPIIWEQSDNTHWVLPNDQIINIPIKHKISMALSVQDSRKLFTQCCIRSNNPTGSLQLKLSNSCIDFVAVAHVCCWILLRILGNLTQASLSGDKKLFILWCHHVFQGLWNERQMSDTVHRALANKSWPFQSQSFILFVSFYSKFLWWAYLS